MSDAWERVFRRVMEPDRYEERLDGALALVSEAAGRPDSYLYLVDASERRLHLAQARARAAGDPTRSPPAPMFERLEGGAESTAPMPPLELVRSPELERERAVASPVGALHSVPLRGLEGRLVGLVQTGPVGRRGLRRAARRAIRQLIGPLGAIVARARAEEAVRRRLGEAEARLERRQRLAGAAVDADRFIALLLDLARNSTGAQAGFVAIVERRDEAPVVRAEAGMPEGFAAEVDLSPEHGLFDWSPASEGGGLILRDFEAAGRLGLAAPIAVPLLEEGEPLGVFVLDFGPGAGFDPAALELLERFAEQIGLMLHNARLFATFSDRYLETVKGLASALDARREHTRGHHGRVAAVAVELARELGSGGAEERAVHDAGLVHDVGLAGAVGVEGGGDADVEHPTLGASLIEHLPIPAAVPGAVATHHEWYDGWGFPRGLSGDQIPRSGRILALAEFLVEMGMGDGLREPWPATRLADEVARRRGSQFDPEIADAALRLGARGALGLPPVDA